MSFGPIRARACGPETGLSRRAILFALAVAPAFAADPAEQVWDVLSGMASALSESDAAGFLRAFDSAMPGFHDLSAAVTGLLREVSLESTIDPAENSGDDRSRTLEVEWSLRLVDREDLDRVTERNATVRIRFERQHGKWKVVSFVPASLFAAPSARVHFPDQGVRGVLLF
jgi:hypothetical protein